jgi:hypothetical protein
MKHVHLFVLVAALVTAATPASAQSYNVGRYSSGIPHDWSRYDTVAIPDIQSKNENYPAVAPVSSPSKIIIIDNRTGDLWAWSEALQTVMYLGYIFPLAGQGPIARIITVPEQRER